MIRRKYLLLFVVSFALLLVGCDNDLGHQSPNDEWIAETLVSEVDVEHSGVDAWFYSEAISDQIFSRMWLKSWKEDCPLNRSELRYLKVLHRNAFHCLNKQQKMSIALHKNFYETVSI